MEWSRLAVFWLCVLLGSVAKAEQDWARLAEPVFQHLDKGLPNGNGMALAQDRAGFIWIGTQGGLARWDGYRFRNYSANRNQAGALPDSFIHALLVDHHGQMWLGTNGAGLVRYDARRDRFYGLPAAAGLLGSVAIWSLADDGEHGIWAASNRGLFHFDAETNQIVHLTEASGLLSNLVRAVLAGKDGSIWIATDRGLQRRLPGAQGRLVAQPFPIGPETMPKVVMLYQASDGKLWIGTARHGVYLLDPASGVMQIVRARDAATGKIDREWILSFQEAAPGEIWAGTFGNGVLRIRQDDMTAERFRHNPGLAHSLIDNTIWSMQRDAAGWLWFGTGRGVSRVEPSQNAVWSLFGGVPNQADDTGISDANVRSLWRAPNGRIWLGLGGNGVDVLDPQQGRVAALRPDPTRPDSALPTGRVFDIRQGPSGQVLLATLGGLYLADADATRVTRLSLPPRASDAEVRVMLPVGDQWWFGGSDGLWAAGDSRGHSWPLVRPDGADRLTDQHITALEPGPGGAVWVGTGNGLNLLHPQSHHLLRILPDPNRNDGLAGSYITTLATDRQGRLWVGTQGNGVHVMEVLGENRTPRFRRIGLAQGLPNASISHILPDQQGAMWVSTDDGLARIDPVNFSVNTLQRADSLGITSYWPRSGVVGSHGELLFGGLDGLTVLFPQRIRPWTYQPPLVLSDVQVNHQHVAFSGSLTLEPQDKHLMFELAALDFSAPERNRYQYRLEGYDPDWINADAAHRNIAWANLPPGEFLLRLRGSNRDGQFSAQELVVPLRVLPAWHQTWWWYIGLGLAGVALIGISVQIRTRFLRRHQFSLKQQVSQRTRQLRKINHQLRAAQTQLVQQEKLAALGGLVAGVAHQINTPLGTTMTAISGIGQLWQQLQDALDSGKISIAQLQSATAEGREYTELAERTVQRAATLITNFKAAAVQHEAGQVQEVDLKHYLEDVVELVRPNLERRGIMLDVSLPDGIRVQMVVEALTEALTRILTNAQEHAFAAGEAGRVRLWVEPTAQGALGIHVSDNGHGIAPENLPKVFDPFFTSEVSNHAGLGLYIAYNHVTQRLHGRLEVRSEVGKGTCMSIFLPLAATSAPTPPATVA
jgi:ligand-binding sensor domain-containing protein/signal transduction histidine kinase